MFPSTSNCASTEKHVHSWTDRQLDNGGRGRTDGRTPERSTSVKLPWSTPRRAKNEYGTKWPTVCEMTCVRNDPGTKWLEMKCVQVNMYVIIFKRSYVRNLARPGKYHMYAAFAYCYQACGSYMRRQGTHRAPAVAICEGKSMRLHIATSWYLFLHRKQEIMTIGRWRAPLYSKYTAKLVQKSHCTVNSRMMVVLCRTNSVLMS